MTASIIVTDKALWTWSLYHAVRELIIVSDKALWKIIVLDSEL